MQVNYDFELDNNDDIVISNGDFVLNESTLQEVGILIRLNSGELRNDPVLAPNLVQLIKSNTNEVEIEQRIRLFLERDGKKYEEIKKVIQLKMY